MNPLEEFRAAATWRRHALDVIRQIPSGWLATYGRIAELVRQRGYSVNARNIAWLRERLYGILGHDTDVSLHRIARVGDINSLADSEDTKELNDRLRREEGFFENQQWL